MSWKIVKWSIRLIEVRYHMAILDWMTGRSFSWQLGIHGVDQEVQSLISKEYLCWGRQEATAKGHCKFQAVCSYYSF